MAIERIRSDISLDGVTIFAEYCDVTERYLLGSRFQTLVKSIDAPMAFNFFNNYAVLLNYAEMPKAWSCFNNLCVQRSNDVPKAFWDCFENITKPCSLLKDSVSREACE